MNDKGLFLVGERFDNSGAWQFPQGGIEEGEDPEEGLMRELAEELGDGCVDIIKRAPQPVAYHFPQHVDWPIAKKYCGQQQTWFLARYRPGHGPDLEKAKDREFRQLAWKSKQEIIDGIIEWKRECYIEGLKGLGL
jgi:putative (di)nucleoside polyphosphate hydrolase